jgi:hypothetical protein
MILKVVSVKYALIVNKDAIMQGLVVLFWTYKVFYFPLPPRV